MHDQIHDIEKLEFSEIIQKLERIVRKLEPSDLSLEAAMKMFEQGIKLAAEGKKRIASNEKRISILLKESDNEELLVPFEATNDSSILSN